MGSMGKGIPKGTKFSEDSARMLVLDSRMRDVALLYCLGVRRASEIAERVGCTLRNIQYIVKDPRFQAIYEETWNKLREDVLETAKDEKVAPIMRDALLGVRARTLLAETIEELRDRIADGGAPGTTLKYAVEAAVAAIDREPGARDRARGGSGAGTQVNVWNVSPEQARATVEALDEAGIDVGDIMEGKYEVVDADVVGEVGPGGGEGSGGDDPGPGKVQGLLEERDRGEGGVGEQDSGVGAGTKDADGATE